MYDYRKEFPTRIIPHVTDTGDICDLIHQLQRPKADKAKNKDSHRAMSTSLRIEKAAPEDEKDKTNKEGGQTTGRASDGAGGLNLLEKDPAANLALVEGTPTLKQADIEAALVAVTSDDTA